MNLGESRLRNCNLTIRCVGNVFCMSHNYCASIAQTLFLTRYTIRGRNRDIKARYKT